MRVLIYTLNYFPEKVGVGKYTGEKQLKVGQSLDFSIDIKKLHFFDELSGKRVLKEISS